MALGASNLEPVLNAPRGHLVLILNVTGTNIYGRITSLLVVHVMHIRRTKK